MLSFIKFKKMTSVLAITVGIIMMVAGFVLMTTQLVAPWIFLFGMFYSLCGSSLRVSLKEEERKRDKQYTKDDDERPNFPLRPV